MSRNRLFLNTLVEGTGGTLFEHTFEWHGELLQYSFHLSAIPALVGSISFYKINPAGAEFTTTIRSYDPAESEIQDLICNEKFQFEIGETLRVTYPNDSAVDIGLQVVLKEAS